MGTFGNGRALGGGALWGHKLMRLTYFDDCGLFSVKEPFIVVGGVILDADRQMIAVEDYLDRLIFKYIPESDQAGFVFHAMDLWHGGPYFVRHKWPRDKRMEIMAELAAIPAKFELLVSFGYQERALIPQYNFPVGATAKTKELVAYTDAVARFCETVERHMREFAPEEVTVLIAEYRDSIQNLLREAHAIYRDHNRIMKMNPLLRYFPFHHIRDTIHFARKKESAHLQIADVCTFIIKKRLMKDPLAAKLFESIKSVMLVLPRDEPQE
jgi:hypothetical protein